MSLIVASPPARGYQGAGLKPPRTGDFAVTVTVVESITAHFIRVRFDDGGLLARTSVRPPMWITLWFHRNGLSHRRAYAVVDPDRDAGTFAVEFAIHDGAAARWAQTTLVGDEITATAMGSTAALPERWPAGWLIVGDAASLPAINALLGAIAASDSPDVPITIWMEYQHDDEFTLPLRTRDHHQVEWVARADGPMAIVDAVRLGVFNAVGYCGWVATEARSARAIAALLRVEFNLGAQVTAQAYWFDNRHGVAASI